MNDTPYCVLCNAKSTEAVYKPINSAVYIRLCWKCGLLQSWPREETGGRLPPSPSAWADFGGLRVGKASRAIPHVRELVKVTRPQNILDVGANRGHFVEEASKAWGHATITGIEPDAAIAKWCKANFGHRLINTRIEKFDLARYDLVYLSHTLEHLPDPLGQLRRLAKALDGLILIEVPNMVDLLRFPDVVEEMFIDRHLYHFTPKTLEKMVYAAGLRTIRNLSTPGYITLICSPGETVSPEEDSEPRLAFEMVKSYEKRLVHNHNDLAQKMGRLNEQLETQAIAAYGAGRIFHACVDYGLRTDGLAVICDRDLAGLVEGVVDPAYLTMPLDKVIIFSRESAVEMEGIARKANPKAEVIEWMQL